MFARAGDMIRTNVINKCNVSMGYLLARYITLFQNIVHLHNTKNHKKTASDNYMTHEHVYAQ